MSEILSEGRFRSLADCATGFLVRDDTTPGQMSQVEVYFQKLLAHDAALRAELVASKKKEHVHTPDCEDREAALRKRAEKAEGEFRAIATATGFRDTAEGIGHVYAPAQTIIEWIEQNNDDLDEAEAESDALRGNTEPGPFESCPDCGRRLVWQRSVRPGEERYPGSWMCPNCVMRRCAKAEAERDRLLEKEEQYAILDDHATYAVAEMQKAEADAKRLREAIEKMLKRWVIRDTKTHTTSIVTSALNELADALERSKAEALAGPKGEDHG